MDERLPGQSAIDRRAFLRRLGLVGAFAVPMISSFTMTGLDQAFAASTQGTHGNLGNMANQTQGGHGNQGNQPRRGQGEPPTPPPTPASPTPFADGLCGAVTDDPHC